MRFGGVGAENWKDGIQIRIVGGVTGRVLGLPPQIVRTRIPRRALSVRTVGRQGRPGSKLSFGPRGPAAGRARLFEGQGLDVREYSRHETVSSREDPGRGDEGAPADMAPAMMQAHLPRPGARLRVGAPHDSGRGLGATAVCKGYRGGHRLSPPPTPEAQVTQDKAPLPTPLSLPPVPRERNKQKFCTSKFLITSTSLTTFRCCSVSKSCLILCDPMDCSTPGFPVLHYLPEFAQIHVH